VEGEAALNGAGLVWGLLAPLTCVVTISIGQLLFKQASGLLDFRRPFAEPTGLAVLITALALYGGATLLWIAVLARAPLARIYPIMSLSFVLVPLGSLILFKERLSLSYWLGSALILAGFLVMSASRAR
jgi:drug/metabolite transporter (DMT)-like permease